MPPAKNQPSGKGAAAPADASSDSAAIIATAKAAAFIDEVPKSAFEHFRPLAETVEPEGLAVFTGQALLLRVNVCHALETIDPFLASAVDKLRNPQLETIFELPALVMALDYAAARVPTVKLSAGDIDRMLAEGAPWREMMLGYFEVISHPLLNLVPQARVQAIREGTGKLDKARDFVSVAGLFGEFAEALDGKHPFPVDKVELLATLGSVLVREIRPGRAPVRTTKRTAESILRDQLAELVVQRYDHLQVVTAVAVGRRKADQLLPALRSTNGMTVSPTPDEEALQPG